MIISRANKIPPMRKGLCGFCLGPLDEGGWCDTCRLFSPRTTAERADMLTRHARFHGLIVPHGPRSGLILSSAAAELAEVDFQAWRGTPAIVEPNFGCDKSASLRLPEDRGRHGDPFRRRTRKDRAA